MNILYPWHIEEMTHLEMEEFKREMDSIHLLKEARLSNPGLLEKSAIAVGKALARIGNRLYRNYTEPHPAHQVTSCKYAA